MENELDERLTEDEAFNKRVDRLLFNRFTDDEWDCMEDDEKDDAIWAAVQDVQSDNDLNDES